MPNDESSAREVGDAMRAVHKARADAEIWEHVMQCAGGDVAKAEELLREAEAMASERSNLSLPSVTFSDEALEAAAKAVAKAEQSTWREGKIHMGGRFIDADQWNNGHRYTAKAAIAAYLAAMEEAGFVMVPSKPTKDMMRAGVKRHPPHGTYVAMLKARPEIGGS